MANTFHCTLVTPERQVLDENVSYVSIPAWDGQVGLMHHRAPLLVKLGQGLMRLDPPQGPSRWFYIAGGFAQMKDDRLSVLTGESVAADELSAQGGHEAMRAAEAMTARTPREQQEKQRRIQRARMLLSLAEKH